MNNNLFPNIYINEYIQWKILFYAVEHPVAKLFKDRITEIKRILLLNCGNGLKESLEFENQYNNIRFDFDIDESDMKFMEENCDDYDEDDIFLYRRDNRTIYANRKEDTECNFAEAINFVSLRDYLIMRRSL